MITAQIELIKETLEELIPLLRTHYGEISLHKDHGFPLDPQYNEYLWKEAAGEVIFVTLREKGVLVGYFVGFIGPGLHYKTCLTLIMDIFYVVPEHRGKKGGVILFSAVEKEARRRGVKLWFVGDKEHAKEHAEALFRYLNFEKAETTFCKWLDNE